MVVEPLPPTFLDNKNFSTEEIIIKSSAKFILSCPVRGRPTPSILWNWTISDSNPQILDPPENTTLEIDQAGIYSCNATNRFGNNWRKFIVQYENDQGIGYYSPIAFGIVTGLLVLVFMALIAGLLFCWCRKRRNTEAFKELSQLMKQSPPAFPIDSTAALNDQIYLLPFNKNYEIDRNQFTLTCKLISLNGWFSAIYKGELKLGDEKVRQVAIKVPKDSCNFEAYRNMLDELKIMSHIRPHVNVLQLVGACTSGLEKRQLFVLTELCEFGSLRDYLLQNAVHFEGFEVNNMGQYLGAPGTIERLLKYAFQASNGMEHLAAEHIIHRDVALRNLLLTHNHIIKIADFGMSRRHSTVYRKEPWFTREAVPIFWMALESLTNGEYTEKSDVWSFGILLWEIFSCGRRPYPDRDDMDYPSFCGWLYRSENNRMGPPKIACDELYQLMLHCWKRGPKTRPSFSACKRTIAEILEKKSTSEYQSILLNLTEEWLNVSRAYQEPVKPILSTDPNETDMPLGQLDLVISEEKVDNHNGNLEILVMEDRENKIVENDTAPGVMQNKNYECPYVAPHVTFR